jgi:hypothetical protein
MNTIETLLKGAQQPVYRALVGFDGSVDSLYHVVRVRSAEKKLPFDDIAQFGRELISRAGLSGGFELAKISVRAGGNAPLMAAALASLGAEVTCVGAMGQPGLHPAYQGLSEACRTISVAPEPNTVALEFGDGKIMLGDTESLDALGWDELVSALGLEEIKLLVGQADLLALVNWAEMPKATGLWQGILERVLDKGGLPDKKRRFFFDLADFNRRNAEELRPMLALLGRFRAHGQVTLGLNENEARQLEDKLKLARGEKQSIEALGKKLMEVVDLDCLVIHPREGATIFEKAGISSVPGRLVAKPVLSTGGGDNFNAGFCTGLLNGLTAKDAASFAVMVSSFYVGNGRSPRRADLQSLMSV